MARLTAVHHVRCTSCWIFLVLLVVGVVLPISCFADTGAQFIAQLPVGATGITRLGYAPGRPNDLFASLLDGTILRVDLTNNAVSTFATIPNAISSLNGQYGTMGFAFAPDFATSGNLYTYDAEDPNPVAGVNHRNYVRKFTLINPLSNSPTLGPAQTVLRIDHPLTDHDGGFLGFQPGDPNDLWITEGDGGNNDGNPDPNRNGQRTTDLLGNVLRVDISGDDFPADPNRNYKIPANNPFANGVGGAPEIWAYGLRSPFSASFDRATGDFILGDVGQVTREEVDFEKAGSAGGRNYGWRTMEGTIYGPFTHDAGELPANDPSFTPPIYDYAHSGGYGSGGAVQFGGRSITAGYVYHGSLAALQGKYIFGDWASRQIWAMNIDRNANGGKGALVPGSLIDLSTAFNVLLTGGTFGSGVTAFGEDQAGELYYSQLDGHLYKIADVVPPPPPPLFALKPTATYRDDFNSSFNYATGSVPGGGIWTSTHNATDFGGSTYNANTTNADQLTIGMQPVGFEGGGSDKAPYLFRQVDAGTLMEVRVKISQQTTGNWSNAGIMIRVPGAIDHVASNDNFLSALSFRTSGTSNQAALSNVIDGVEGENDTAVASANDLMFLRLVNEGNGQFEFFTSSDGTNWISRQKTTNTALASGNIEVGIWAGAYPNGINSGTTQFDWAQIMLGVPAGDYNGDGFINAADYTVWRDTLGQLVTAYSGADGNGDGMITSADYDIWKGNFGKTIPIVGSGATSAVPEPNSSLLLVLSCCGLYQITRRWAPRIRRPDRSD